VRNADGTTTRGVGNGQQGTWIVIDGTAMNGPGFYQVDLQVGGRGTFATRPVFFGSPTFVRFIGTLSNADYVRPTPAKEPPSVSPVVPKTGSGTTVLLTSAMLITLTGIALRAASRFGRRERIELRR
jgi:hypothetical protein